MNKFITIETKGDPNIMTEKMHTKYPIKSLAS